MYPLKEFSIMKNKIAVIQDPNLTFDPIEDIVYMSDDVDQTRLTGVLFPIITLNGWIIRQTQIKQFKLQSVDHLPSLSLIISDSLGLIKSLNSPKSDNNIQIQILPPFDGVYKKIQMNFYISSYRQQNKDIYIQAIYNVKDLYKSQLLSYGKINTYELFQQIASSTKIGFASNVSNLSDTRYIYHDNKSHIDLMNKEVSWGGTESIVLDYWIDWYNYLNLVDLKSLISKLEEDLYITVPANNEVDIEASVEQKTTEIECTLSNHPATINSQLHIKSYTPVNNNGLNIVNGTDKVIEYYDFEAGSCMSVMMQDGNTKNDIFIKSTYEGEKIGEFNYFTQKACNDIYKQKISNRGIEVVLYYPVLGIQRGSTVNLMWYDTNDLLTGIQDTEEYAEDLNQSATPASQTEDSEGVVLNKIISGQYMVVKTELIYEFSKLCWNYKLFLIPIDLK